MARYTLPLSNLIEMVSQETDTLSFDERIDKGREWLFDFDYPYFKEETRKDFETHFIYHFYNREIGFETEQLFKFKLRTWLNLNMPYWNKMLETDDLIKEPLVNVNWTRTLKGDKERTDKEIQKGMQETLNNENVKVSGNESEKGKSALNQKDQSTGKQDTFQRDLKTDTPDSRLQITTGEGTGVIEYASEIGENKNTTSATNTNTQESTASNENNRTTSGLNETTAKGNISAENTNDRNTNDRMNETEHTKGNMGMKTESEMIELYRRILMKWEPMIFKEMEQLFMLVY